MLFGTVHRLLSMVAIITIASSIIIICLVMISHVFTESSIPSKTQYDMSLFVLKLPNRKGASHLHLVYMEATAV